MKVIASAQEAVEIGYFEVKKWLKRGQVLLPARQMAVDLLRVTPPPAVGFTGKSRACVASVFLRTSCGALPLTGTLAKLYLQCGARQRPRLCKERKGRGGDSKYDRGWVLKLERESPSVSFSRIVRMTSFLFSLPYFNKVGYA